MTQPLPTHPTTTLQQRPHVAANEFVIEANQLTIGWTDTVVQRNLTFQVKYGEIFGILGRSGSGKSTLLRFLVGLERPLSGAISLAGGGRPNLEAGLPPFGVMFQAGALFGGLTLEENVALPIEKWTSLPKDAIAAIARAKLKLVGLEGASGKSPAELSGGMKKRAAIARALALDPELVFLDEPSAGLDPVTANELDELMSTLAKTLGITVVVVTHDLDSVISIVDRIILLDKDEQTIIAVGDPREVRHSSDSRVAQFFNRTRKDA